MLTLRSIVVVTLAATFVACGPGWRLVRSSGTPSALAGVTSFAVTFDYGSLEIDDQTEAAWMAAQDPGEQTEYLALRASLEETFLTELGERVSGATFARAEVAAPDAYPLVLRYDELAMGSFAPIYSTASRLDVTVRLGSGDLVDEFEVRTSRRADVYNTQRAQRLTWCVEHVTETIAEYLRRAR